MKKRIPLFFLVITLTGCYLDGQLYSAVRKKDWESVRILLEKGADPNIRIRRPFGQETTLLIRAADKGRSDIVALALEKEADPNALDSRGETALHKLGYGASDPDIAKLLIMSGADINYFTGNQTTPLSRAVQAGHYDLVSVYLEFNADVNLSSGFENWSPLMYAAQSGYEKITEDLINAGADLNKTDRTGKTALMIAVGSGKDHIAVFLLEAGADSTLRDKNGQDYLDHKAAYQLSQETTAAD